MYGSPSAWPWIASSNAALSRTLRLTPNCTPEPANTSSSEGPSDPALLLDAARAGHGVLLAMDASMASEVAAGRLCTVRLPANRLTIPGILLPASRSRACA